MCLGRIPLFRRIQPIYLIYLKGFKAMLETEIKSLLNKKQYDVICGMFSFSSSVNQTNTYYTAPLNALKQYGITFRIRTVDKHHVIQIKQHKSNRNALQISEESEYPINSVPESFSETEVYGYTGISVPVFSLGELSTLRMSCIYCDGVEICLDKSTYLGTTDYEIEIEYTAAIPDELMTKLVSAGILFDKPASGKYSRFLARLKEI